MARSPHVTFATCHVLYVRQARWAMLNLLTTHKDAAAHRVSCGHFTPSRCVWGASGAATPWQRMHQLACVDQMLRRQLELRLTQVHLSVKRLARAHWPCMSVQERFWPLWQQVRCSLGRNPASAAEWRQKGQTCPREQPQVRHGWHNK